MTDRIVKNPSRVPWISQVVNPVGRNPGGRYVITQGESAAMPVIEKTGTYEDGEGNRFLYREGHPMTAEQKDDLTLKDAGLVQTDAEKARYERQLAHEKRLREEQGADVAPAEVDTFARRALPGAPENRMEQATVSTRAPRATVANDKAK